jgi:uncharacterized membrane protein
MPGHGKPPLVYHKNNKARPFKKAGLTVFVLIFLVAGANHFLNPESYRKIIPQFLPNPTILVYLSGLFEIILGLLLIPVSTRKTAAWGIMLLLVAVFPANIQMMLNYLQENRPYAWLTVARLPVQGLLIWWAYLYAKKSPGSGE